MVCRVCRVYGPTVGRGLCGPCRRAVIAVGLLEDYPRIDGGRSMASFLDDFIALHGEGYTPRQIAERLSYSYHSMRRQLQRAKTRGLIAIRDGVIQA